jgi:translation initiation factor IF-2
MRVYELAKKLSMENRALIPELKRLGISVASHSSTLDDESVKKALDKLMPQGDTAETMDVRSEEAGRKALKKGSGSGKDALGSRESKPSFVEQAVRDSGKVSGSKASLIEEAPKPDKKRILFKRKKSEDEIIASSHTALSTEIPFSTGDLSTETTRSAPSTTSAPAAGVPMSGPSSHHDIAIEKAFSPPLPPETGR